MLNNYQLHKNILLSRNVMESMLHYARKMAVESGFASMSSQLLEAADKSPGLNVRNNRIFFDEHLWDETITFIRENTIPGSETGREKNTILNFLTPRPQENNYKIRVNERPSLYSDHRSGVVRPLTREDVIFGTKMIDSLCNSSNIIGNTCGTPQDGHSNLQGIEQYLIGYRYNRNGGTTEVPVPLEVKEEYFSIREIAEEGFNRKNRDFSIWTVSPMRLDADELDEMFAPGQNVKTILVGSMPIMGLTGPVDPVGVYTLSVAEIIGGAAVFHSIFPEARLVVFPHPQAMDLGSGIISFGSPEHNRLEAMKMEFFKHLNLPYMVYRDVMTSSPMPDLVAQSEKMLNIVTGLTQGYTSFSIMPLCADEAWSYVQCLLDIEHIQSALHTHTCCTDADKAKNAFESCKAVIESNFMFGELDDTLMNMMETYRTDGLFKRYFSADQWKEHGFTNYIQVAEDRAHALVEASDYYPDENKLLKMLDVYAGLCRKMGVEPMTLK